MSTPCPSDDRCECFRKRLDAHLATLPDDSARRAFLTCEAIKWRGRYSDFTFEVATGIYRGTGTAFEFVATIADIEARRVSYAQAERVSA